MHRRFATARTAGCAVVAALVLAPAHLGGQARQATDQVAFATTGQSLWGPGTGVLTKSFRTDIINQSVHGQRGQIQHIQENFTLDNAHAQAVWDRALSRCTGSSYMGFHPSRSNCINGFTYPCPTWRNPGRTCHVRGMGGRPSGSITVTRPFDAGAEVAWDVHFQWGIMGGLTLDGGSVDIDFNGAVTLDAGTEPVSAGETFMLRTGIAHPAATVRSRAPSLGGYIDSYMNTGVTVGATVAAPNMSDGSQYRQTQNFIDIGTDGEYRQRLIGFRLATDGLHLQLLNAALEPIQPDVELTASIMVLKVPDEGGDALSVELPIVKVGLRYPRLDTPVPSDFRGVAGQTVFDGHQVVDTIAPGSRTTFRLGDNVDSGRRDTDFGVVDFDVDVLSAVATDVPVNYQASVGDLAPDLSLLKAQASLFTLDALAFFGFRQDLTFEPRLQAQLAFSQPTEVETAPGSGQFQRVTSKTVLVGDNLQIRHPGGDLTITPTYTVANNLFVNDTDMIMSPVIRGTMLELKLSGLLFDTFGAALDLPTDIAAGEIMMDLAPEPVKLLDVNFLNDDPEAHFTLRGFETVAGTALRISAGN